MDCCEERSAIRRSVCGLPLCASISCRACAPLAGSRLTSTTVAPSFASPSAVALPIPEFAPVIRQILPCMVEDEIDITVHLSKIAAFDHLDKTLLQFIGAWPRFAVADH